MSKAPFSVFKDSASSSNEIHVSAIDYENEEHTTDAKPFMIFPDNLSPAKEVQSSRVGFDIFEDNHSNQNDNAHEKKAEMKKASLTVFKEKSALHESTEFESDSESDEQNEFNDKYSNGDTATFSMLRDTIKGLDCYMSPRIKSTVNNAEKDKDTLILNHHIGIQLQELEQLNLQPRTGRPAVQILPRACPLQHQHPKDVDHVRNQRLVILHVTTGQTNQQRQRHVQRGLPTHHQFGRRLNMFADSFSCEHFCVGFFS